MQPEARAEYGPSQRRHQTASSGTASSASHGKSRPLSRGSTILRLSGPNDGRAHHQIEQQERTSHTPMFTFIRQQLNSWLLEGSPDDALDLCMEVRCDPNAMICASTSSTHICQVPRTNQKAPLDTSGHVSKAFSCHRAAVSHTLSIFCVQLCGLPRRNVYQTHTGRWKTHVRYMCYMEMHFPVIMAFRALKVRVHEVCTKRYLGDCTHWGTKKVLARGCNCGSATQRHMHTCMHAYIHLYVNLSMYLCVCMHVVLRIPWYLFTSCQQYLIFWVYK